MRAWVASAFVSVALLGLADSAQAYSGTLAPSRLASDYIAYYDGAYGPFYNGYWTEKNEYFFARGAGQPYVRDDGRHFRHVMITGYHPVEGFGPELSANLVGAR